MLLLLLSSGWGQEADSYMKVGFFFSSGGFPDFTIISNYLDSGWEMLDMLLCGIKRLT